MTGNAIRRFSWSALITAWNFRARPYAPEQMFINKPAGEIRRVVSGKCEPVSEIRGRAGVRHLVKKRHAAVACSGFNTGLRSLAARADPKSFTARDSRARSMRRARLSALGSTVAFSSGSRSRLCNRSTRRNSSLRLEGTEVRMRKS